jgi:hypothetical protein
MAGPDWLTGSKYNWDIDNMTAKCNIDLVNQFYLAYFGLDDEAASAILKQASKTSLFIL